MYDTIRGYIITKDDLTKYLDKVDTYINKRTGEIRDKGIYKNLQFFENAEGYSFSGSLTNCVLGHNFSGITHQQTNDLIQTISTTLNLDFTEAKLTRIDFGNCIEVEDIPEFNESPSRLNKLLEKAHPPIGKIIMDTWDFPEELKLVASEYVDFQRDSGEKADYVDLVQVAFLQSIAGTNHPACRIDWNTVPSFAKLGMAPDEEILEIEGISEEIELAQSMLT